ncbi:hypothetical protein TW82_08550 [Pseudoalteromonas fuliginea]|uniref:Uncharacterized protein n=1 Tax=Pseudoalteromonas fuliginea TaxID=1872678 RepID=A0ABD3Y6I3_9GAMM|nr:hypothetical protein AOR04_15250 [Pseudoalteromonas sp. 1_2015MBL_MicDiv]KDC49656.1 hypothetical protein DC53_15670 [Pseudoalteromonas fuliginea]KDC54874.1 hypothetical protein DO88_06280 [Pseudoalteromonas sp. S3431]KJZ28163.1 hypothetical protein TW82_08550 [Pseudoalteromonas fuliginea]
MISEREKLKAPPNYFQTSKVWWFSKPWAVALTTLIIILPAIKTYIDILSYLFKVEPVINFSTRQVKAYGRKQKSPAFSCRAF